MDDLRVYSWDDLIADAPEEVISPPLAAEVGRLILNPQANPPEAKFAALLENDGKFFCSWHRQRDDLQDQSASSYDLSLAALASETEWTDQEIANLMITNRREHGDDLKLRQSYYQATIRRARTGMQPQTHDHIGEANDMITPAQNPQDCPRINEPQPSQVGGGAIYEQIVNPGGNGGPTKTPVAVVKPASIPQWHKDSLIVVEIAEVEPEPVIWLWPGRIAIGKLTILVGNPGLGKSTISLDIAARVSTGTGWPGSLASTSEPGGVILLSAEDDIADTIRPRLDAAGAAIKRIRAVTTAKHYSIERKQSVFEPFCLEVHLPLLEETIDQTINCRLVIIDPISAFMGKTDSHNNAEVRGLLAPLSQLAARHHVAVVAVSHMNKGQGDAINRIMGSMAFAAAARAVYACIKDKDDPTRRLFLPVKNNIAEDTTGFAYRLIQEEGRAVPTVAWDPLPVTMSADDAVAPDRLRRGPEPERREEAQAWLTDFLQPGPQSAKSCLDEARNAGIARHTLLNAKFAIGIVVERSGFGPGSLVTWGLPVKWVGTRSTEGEKSAFQAMMNETT